MIYFSLNVSICNMTIALQILKSYKNKNHICVEKILGKQKTLYKLDKKRFMIETEKVVRLIFKMLIILNARKLGWNVEVNEGSIILTKNNDKLTKIDKDTSRLIHILFNKP